MTRDTHRFEHRMFADHVRQQLLKDGENMHDGYSAGWQWRSLVRVIVPIHAHGGNLFGLVSGKVLGSDAAAVLRECIGNLARNLSVIKVSHGVLRCQTQKNPRQIGITEDVILWKVNA